MPATILIIDDDPDIGTLIAQLLCEEGFAVLYVDSGAAGLVALAATPPDLVLLDFRMPGMDGAAFVRESERQGLRKSIPIILVSASDSVKARAQLAHTDAYLGKPFEPADLLRIVSQHLPPPIV